MAQALQKSHQLLTRQCLHPSTRAAAVRLRSTRSLHPCRCMSSQHPRLGTSASSSRPSGLASPITRPGILSSRRPFSTSSQRHKVLLNPRTDEDGNEMDVEITQRAANRLKQIMSNESNPDLALRVTVESGGCHGFQYLMSLTNMSQVSQEEDTVFEGDEGARVVMDEPSLELLKGSKVDYTMELIGSQFKIVDNPFASSSCGCGTSFDIKP